MLFSFHLPPPKTPPIPPLWCTSGMLHATHPVPLHTFTPFSWCLGFAVFCATEKYLISFVAWLAFRIKSGSDTNSSTLTSHILQASLSCSVLRKENRLVYGSRAFVLALPCEGKAGVNHSTHRCVNQFSGKSGSGRVRAPMKKEAKQNVSKKLKVANLSSGQTNGLNSSLVFTPIQVRSPGTRVARRLCYVFHLITSLRALIPCRTLSPHCKELTKTSRYPY